MGETLKVDCEVLESAIEQMNSASEEFSAFTENGFKDEITALDGMNSDFVEKLTRVLEISKKWNLDKLNKNLAHYSKEAKTIYEEIKKADEALAGVEE